MYLVKYLNRTNSFIRFLLVGIANTIVGFSVIMLLLNGLGLSYWVSTFIGNSVGAAVSFFLNRGFTFQSDITYRRGIPRFVFIIFVSYLLSYSLSQEIASQMHSTLLLPVSKENLAVLLGMGLYTIINYFGQKYLVFVKTSSPMS
ncbi:MAG TPA: GtrA family protein [Bacillus sp. (in: firmicutes)]|uniref:GtrA family protein n=1 Tax=Bacillus litorisediminis TaxID=2922713 RepID=UPI001FAD80AF|nr:GtrA family protein [Bacillus litorisediminis]HWO75800.1 GtrA family protein [Bacillus sp. (in: firmicutes)]